MEHNMSHITTVADCEYTELNGAMVNVHPNVMTLYITNESLKPFHTPETWRNREKTETWILMLREDHDDEHHMGVTQGTTVALRKDLIDVVRDVDFKKKIQDEGQIDDIKYRKMNLRAYKFPITKDYNGFDPLLAEMAAALRINYKSLMKHVR